MSHLSRTWDTAYEASPADTDDMSNDALRMRELKKDIRERMEQDHSWAGDEDDGHHKIATFMKRGSDPSAETDKLIVFTKTNSDKLYGIEPGGETLELTPPVASGMPFFLNSEPNGYIFADGMTIGNNTSGADHTGERFRELFDAIKSVGYGNAGTEDFDSSDTVQLPDLRDRVPVGQNDMGNSDAGRIGTYSTGMADTGGEDSHTLTISEMPSHDHGGSTGGKQAAGLQLFIVSSAASGPSATGLTESSFQDAGTKWSGDHVRDVTNHSHGISSQGGGGAHNNVQPFLVVNWIIKY